MAAHSALGRDPEKDDGSESPDHQTTGPPSATDSASSRRASDILTPALSGPQDLPSVGPCESNNAAAATSTEPTPAPAAAEPEAQRTKLQTAVIVTSLCAALFLAALDVSIITVAIPSISHEFNSTVGYTWIGSAYLLAGAAAAPVWGKISDIWGRKQILLIAVAVFWVGSLMAALSVSMIMLIVARAVQGLGGGGIVILVNVCIGDLFSIRKRGLYFAFTGAVWAIAGGIGPVIGGAFTAGVTWRWCFWLNLPVSGAGFFALMFFLKLHNPRTPMRQGLAAVDWLGAATIIGGTLMLLLGLTFGGVVYPWASAPVICLIVFGLLTEVLFVFIEWKYARYPIIPLRLFRRLPAVASFGASAFQGIVFISGSYYLPLYFQAVLGASPLNSGLYILPFTVSLAVVSMISGLLIRRTGKYWWQIIGAFVFMVLGYGLFLDFGTQVNWAKIVMYQIIAGIGVGPLFQAPLIALHTTVAKADVASATATYQFIRQLSTTISVVIGGVVFQNGMQSQYEGLLRDLGPEVANLLSGADAAASVETVAKIQGPVGDQARAAYWHGLRTMYYMYVGFAACGLLVSFFVGQRTLSKDHTETKTGLNAMRAQERGHQEARPLDVEKAQTSTA